MNCYISGIIGIGLLTASFATMTISKDQTDYLKSILSEDIANKYTCIIEERRNLYFQGLFIGLILAFVLMRFVKLSNTFHRITFSLAIVIFTSIIYYQIMPKSDYMLNHLKTKEEIVAWLDVYKRMKYTHIYGFILGSIAAVPISYMLC